MNEISGQKMREVLLQIIDKFAQEGPGYLQSGSILNEVARNLNILGNIEQEQALLTMWHDLFRDGQLAWVYNIANNAPPFCHVTAKGRAALQNMSRDPANPDGYLFHLNREAPLDPIANSYIEEALKTYNGNCFKATAVMVGCAAESLTIELRDNLVARMTSLGKTAPKDLSDWKIRTVLMALQRELNTQKMGMLSSLREEFEAYWPAFTQQIRAVRNDAGHPASIVPVTHESVHAALLIFTELARLTQKLKSWINTSYS